VPLTVVNDGCPVCVPVDGVRDLRPIRTYTSPVSDAADNRPAKPISMEKKPAAASTRTFGRPKGDAGKSPAPSVPIPRTIQWATIAIAAQIAFTLGRGLSLRGYTSELKQWLIDSNDKAKGKSHKSPYTTADINHDLSSLRNSLLLQGVVVCIALAILGVSMRRARGASGSRWALIIIIILTSGPLAVIPIAGFPSVPKILGVLMGVASIAVIVLVLLPESLRYFRACKAATRPEGAAVRPGLGSMFGGRGAAGGARGAGAGRGSLFGPRPSSAGAPAASEPESSTPDRPTSKAKVRAEADAVAKGAELARTRAKASKSRRTETS
jgi:hypothetical protein